MRLMKLTLLRLGLEINSTEKSPCREAVSFSSIQKILRMLWNPEGLLAPSQDSASYLYAEPDKSYLHSSKPISLRFVLISSHLHLDFSSGFISRK